MAAKKKKVKKASRIVIAKDASNMTAPVIFDKMRMIVTNLIFFIILFLVCVLLYSFSGSKVYQDLFFMFAMGFGIVGMAFLIALLVFFFLRLMKKR